MKALVSVIIPTFNRAHYLKDCLDKIVAQTYKPLEIIVVDDASNDNTKEILELYNSNITKIFHKENRGVSAARNTGITQAKGTYIAFCDSDDLWNVKKIEHQMRVFQNNPFVKVCHTDEIWIRNGKRVNPKKHHYKAGGWIFERCLELCAVSPSSVMMHRKFFDEVGIFDESFPACEDYDLWLRASLRYPFFYLSQQLLIKQGGHEDQLSKKYWGMDQFRIQAIIKCLENSEIPARYREKAVAVLKNKCEIVLQGATKRSKEEESQKYLEIISRYC